MPRAQWRIQKRWEHLFIIWNHLFFHLFIIWNCRTLAWKLRNSSAGLTFHLRVLTVGLHPFLNHKVFLCSISGNATRYVRTSFWNGKFVTDFLHIETVKSKLFVPETPALCGSHIKFLISVFGAFQMSLFLSQTRYHMINGKICRQT